MEKMYIYKLGLQAPKSWAMLDCLISNKYSTSVLKLCEGEFLEC